MYDVLCIGGIRSKTADSPTVHELGLGEDGPALAGWLEDVQVGIEDLFPCSDWSRGSYNHTVATTSCLGYHPQNFQ